AVSRLGVSLFYRSGSLRALAVERNLNRLQLLCIDFDLIPQRLDSARRAVGDRFGAEHTNRLASELHLRQLSKLVATFLCDQEVKHVSGASESQPSPASLRGNRLESRRASGFVADGPEKRINLLAPRHHPA